MGRRGARSDAAVRAKPLILLNGDKVTLVALPDSLICTNICDSHPNNITDAMERSLLSVVVVTDAQSGCTGFYNLTHGWQLLAAEGHWSWHQSFWTPDYAPSGIWKP
jgi:hypothetical protein